MKAKIIFLFILSLFVLNKYSYSKTVDNVVSNDKFDTLKVIVLKNRIYKKERIKIIDLKDIDRSVRRIVLNINKKKYLLCDLDENDFSGFSIDKIDENKDGFEISIEYGSRIYWNRIFYFTYKNGCFSLNKILSVHFDKYKNKSPIKTDRKCEIPVYKGFNILSYLNY